MYIAWASFPNDIFNKAQDEAAYRFSSVAAQRRKPMAFQLILFAFISSPKLIFHRIFRPKLNIVPTICICDSLLVEFPLGLKQSCK